MSGPVVAMRCIGHRFGPRVALRDVELEVGAGTILGLCGPNGSGKTTLLKILAGLLRPTRGTAEVFGRDPRRHRRAVMERARFAFAPPPLYDALTAREHIELLGRLGQSQSPTRGDVDTALATVGLDARGDDRVATYSFGMRQRLALAQALIPLPELLVLDEPADGLDPLAVIELRGVIERLRDAHGVTIVLASHLMLELDRLVDHLVVLDEGTVAYAGTPDALRGARAVIRIEVDDTTRAHQALEDRGLAVEVLDDGALGVPHEAAPDLEATRAILAGAAVSLLGYSAARPSLEAALLERLRTRRPNGVDA